MIRKVLQKNVACCIWLIEAMSNQDMIKEFFVECPINDMSRFMAGLMKTAMANLYVYEKEKIDAYVDWMNNGQHIDFIKQSQS